MKDKSANCSKKLVEQLKYEIASELGLNSNKNKIKK